MDTRLVVRPNAFVWRVFDSFLVVHSVRACILV
jgi:hypothetical protein